MADEEIASDTGAVAIEAEPSFNMESAVEKIAAELFTDRNDEPDTPGGPVTGAMVAPVAETPAPVAAEPTVRQAPKAWPKEMHEYWGKVDPKVQEYLELREKQMLEGLDAYKGDAQYGKSLKEVMAPFQSTLQQYRLEPHQAVHSLMVAHTRLTQGTMDDRRTAYEELGRNLGLTAPTGNGSAAAAPPQIDPQLAALQQELQSMKQSLTVREQADNHAAQQRVMQEIEAFAADAKAHPHFQDVTDDITVLLKGGVVSTLQEAYDRAIWMNPVVRAKEVAAAQQAEAAKLKENARLDALKAKTAASSNVHNRDTKRAPTEPIGTMEDTIKEGLRSIRSRTHTTP